MVSCLAVVALTRTSLVGLEELQHDKDTDRHSLVKLDVSS